MRSTLWAALAATGMVFATGVALGGPNDIVGVNESGKVSRAPAEAGSGPGLVEGYAGSPLVAASVESESAAAELASELFWEGVEDAGLTVEKPEPVSTALFSYAGTESVIGPDHRRRVYTSTFPERATVYITYNGNAHCSGAMIGPSAVATAGHCVERGTSGGFYTPGLFRVYPASDGTYRPYGYCTAKELWTVAGWANNGDDEYDYGAIILNCTVGNSTGYYGWTTANPQNQPTTIPGYPGDKPAGQQYQSNDKVRATGALKIFYPNDTYGGMSGSPVWYDKNGAYMIGIHGYGVGGTGYYAIYNSGVRITSAVSANLLTWRNRR